MSFFEDQQRHDKRPQRTLTDEDIQALADELDRRLMERFYNNVGRGVWAMAMKWIIAGIAAVAAYGVYKGLLK